MVDCNQFSRGKLLLRTIPENRNQIIPDRLFFFPFSRASLLHNIPTHFDLIKGPIRWYFQWMESRLGKCEKTDGEILLPSCHQNNQKQGKSTKTQSGLNCWNITNWNYSFFLVVLFLEFVIIRSSKIRPQSTASVDPISFTLWPHQSIQHYP